MKKVLILVMAGALLLGSLSMVFATESTGTVTGTTYSVYNPPAPVVPPVKPLIKGRTVVEGVVYAVYGDTLTLKKFQGKNKFKLVTFTTNAQTKIIWNKKALKAANAEIQKGSRVLVKGWLLSNGKLTAVEIKVLKGKVLPKKKVVLKNNVLIKEKLIVKKEVIIKKEVKTIVKKDDNQTIIKKETTIKIEPAKKKEDKQEGNQEKGNQEKGNQEKGSGKKR